MRIVILTSDNLYAKPVMNRLLDEFSHSIVGVFQIAPTNRKSNFLKTLRIYHTIAGFRYLTTKALKSTYFKTMIKLDTWFGLAPGLRLLRPWTDRYRQRNIPLFTADNINKPPASIQIRGMNPDLILSVLFSQILNENIINIPRIGCLNIHPSYLPKNRGVSPIFWSLANGDDYAGYSIHFIDTGIDTGPLIKREKIRIENYDTEHSLYLKCIISGTNALLEAIHELESGVHRKIDVTTETQSYHSRPTRIAYREFKQRGRRFFKFSDIRTRIDQGDRQPLA